MGYDIFYHSKPCGHCGRTVAMSSCIMHPAYDIAPILHTSLGKAGIKDGFNGLHGKTGREIDGIIRKAIGWIVDPANEATLLELVPRTGHGDASTVVKVYKDLLHWSKADPDGILDTKFGKGLPGWVVPAKSPDG